MHNLLIDTNTNVKDVTAAIGQPVGYGLGKISAGKITEEQAAEFAEATKACLVEIDKTSPSCCIDGRLCVTCLDSKSSGPRPALAGGAGVSAYAGAELAGYFSKNDKRNSLARYHEVASLLQHAGITIGGHCAINTLKANFSEGTGCAASDKLRSIIHNISEHNMQVTAITEALMNASGGRFGPSYMQFEQDSVLQNHTVDYESTEVLESLDKGNVEVLQSQNTPTGGHEEKYIVLVYKHGYTIDRAKLFALTGEQFFLVTPWYIDELAQALASGPEATKQYEALRHAMYAYQAATALTLTDGSQPLIVIN